MRKTVCFDERDEIGNRPRAEMEGFIQANDVEWGEALGKHARSLNDELICEKMDEARTPKNVILEQRQSFGGWKFGYRGGLLIWRERKALDGFEDDHEKKDDEKWRRADDERRCHITRLNGLLIGGSSIYNSSRSLF
jgi:hypothetical protein